MVSMWGIKFTKKAIKDKKLHKESNLEKQAKKILNVIMENPYKIPPSYEKLTGELSGYYSRRINIQHRIVYKVYKDINTVVIHAMWTHYQ